MSDQILTVEAAQAIVLETIHPLGVERVDLLRSLHRVLAEDVASRGDIPPYHNSSVDGYAVRAEDVQEASTDHPAVLDVVEELPAGHVPARTIGPSQSARIMTGGMLPDGADAVVMVERTILAADRVRVLKPVKPGQNVRDRGEDVKAGQAILRAGTELGPGEIGLLAALQRSFVAVRRQPTVAILSTGDELVEIDELLTLGKIVNSNSYALAALVIEAGGQPIRLGISRDTRDELERKLRDGLGADVILTSGGVSVGEYDFVKEALAALGTEMEFWKVAMTPGRPFAFGSIQGKLAFGLPGNPVASMVTFELFVRPALLKMSGHTRLYRPTVRAILTEDIKKMPGRKQFIRMRLTERGGRYEAARTGAQGSGILRSMSLASGLAITHEDQSLIRAGEEVEVMLLGGEWERAEQRSC